MGRAGESLRSGPARASGMVPKLVPKFDSARFRYSEPAVHLLACTGCTATCNFRRSNCSMGLQLYRISAFHN